MTRLTPGFLWGAATAPHQVEGNNVNSDWWQRELRTPGMERSGDAVDSYHRYAEDMRLLAEAGLTSYRFGIEWARVEPDEGQISRAALAHYRRMIDTAAGFGLTPVVTLHHFTAPRWFAEDEGWLGPKAIGRFGTYVQAVTGILGGVEWVCTMNEPNMLAIMVWMSDPVRSAEARKLMLTPTVADGRYPVLPDPDPEVGLRLAEAHHAAREILKRETDAKAGWTVANHALTATPGNEAKLREVRYVKEDLYLEAARGDDFIGVQSYSSQAVDQNGVVPHPSAPDNTLTGNAYRPDAIGIALRHTWEVTGGVPILVTENGIATADDTQRIAYTSQALRHLFAAVDDGIDVRGYLHWSALDNFEWGHWKPTFGLIAVDRETFERQPKPSLAWLGEVARRGHL
ncbi:glycoside hydrolase family 1 protein [Streptomyces sp. NBC_01314]|uniref:glycoside hydrolase family 1 protein n=1 Tax=Streptomyces sp. NBC_01314 TaxID=2903821 RepID=UPI0030920947|nr:family 1 glycosylhydrolase [Streptomyces sp. NBC_01314]